MSNEPDRGWCTHCHALVAIDATGAAAPHPLDGDECPGAGAPSSGTVPGGTPPSACATPLWDESYFADVGQGTDMRGDVVGALLARGCNAVTIDVASAPHRGLSLAGLPHAAAITAHGATPDDAMQELAQATGLDLQRRLDAAERECATLRETQAAAVAEAERLRADNAALDDLARLREQHEATMAGNVRLHAEAEVARASERESCASWLWDFAGTRDDLRPRILLRVAATMLRRRGDKVARATAGAEGVGADGRAVEGSE